MCVHALGRDGTWCVCACVRVCAFMSLLGQDLVCMHVCVCVCVCVLEASLSPPPVCVYFMPWVGVCVCVCSCSG